MAATLLVIAALALALGAVLRATVRTVSQDRPRTPPGTDADWRAAELSWKRLGIS